MSYCITPKEAEEVIRRARGAIGDYFHANNLTFAVFGESEGLDSSVIAGLFSGIPGIKPIGVLMPIESNPEATRVGQLVLDHFKIPAVKVDLTAEYHAILGKYNRSGSVADQLIDIAGNYGDLRLLRGMISRRARAFGNIKSRLRMITLYHIAQLVGGIVISTDNYSEYWMGFWTLNGDVGDLSPIQQIFKGLELYAVAKALGVPRESLDAVPTDGLEVIPGGTDEDQLGLPYSDLDRVIVRLLQSRFHEPAACDDASELLNCLSEELGYSVDKIAHVANQMRSTHFKRNWPVEIDRATLGLPDVDTILV